jgi:hypothetical protein
VTDPSTKPTESLSSTPALRGNRVRGDGLTRHPPGLTDDRGSRAEPRLTRHGLQRHPSSSSFPTAGAITSGLRKTSHDGPAPRS